MYRVSLEFERYFVQQLLKPMQSAGSMFGGEDGGSQSTSGYQDMAQDQLTQSVLDGGGLGLAATLYGQMAEAAGIASGDSAATDGGSSSSDGSTGGAA